MPRSLKLLPSILLAVLVGLILKADPPRSVRAQPSFLALITCEAYDAEDYYISDSSEGTYVLASLVPDCEFNDVSVEVEPVAEQASYRLKLRWLDPVTGLPRTDTFPIHAEEDVLEAVASATLHSSSTASVCRNDVLLKESLPWKLGLTAEVSPERRVAIDLTPGQVPPSRDLLSGQDLPGVLAYTTTNTTSSTISEGEHLLLAEQLVVTGEAASSSSTEELIVEFDTPASTTAFLASAIELAIASETDDDDMLEVIIVDPLGQPEPLPGPGTVTSTMSSLTLEKKPTASLPSFLPAVETTSTELLQADTRYWLVIKVKGQWSLGADTSQGGTGRPEKMWRRAFDGTVEELPADLAFQFVGWATMTLPVAVDPIVGLQPSLNMRISPAPFRGRTQIRFEGSGNEASMQIFDLHGRRVRSLRLPMQQGWGEFVWDGRDDGGRIVAAGSYLVRVHTDAGQSASRKVIRID